MQVLFRPSLRLSIILNAIASTRCRLRSGWESPSYVTDGRRAVADRKSEPMCCTCHDGLGRLGLVPKAIRHFEMCSTVTGLRALGELSRKRVVRTQLQFWFLVLNEASKLSG